MSWDQVCDSVCPIARALAVVGDRWTLLILRELSLNNTRFDEIQAQTGMSSFLLSTRLKRLEHDGVVERHLYSERPARYEYRTTVMGRELDPLLLMLRGWGMRWLTDDCEEPSLNLTLNRTGEPITATWTPTGKDSPFSFDMTSLVFGPRFAAERLEKRASFSASRRETKR